MDLGPTSPRSKPDATATVVVDLVSGCPTFRGVAKDVLRQILSLSTERLFEPGDHLLRQGDPGDALLVLLEGRARVAIRNASGESQVIAQVQAGDVIGEMALVTGEPRNADVIATEPVRALNLDSEHFHRMVGANARLAMVFTNMVADRLGSEEIDGLSEKVLNGFRIKRRIGTGATAVVYEAEEESTGNRVALKMMSHRLIFELDAPRRFQREADLVESLRHENIACLYGRFEAYKTYFLSMEYCDGLSLAELLSRRGWLEPAQVRAIMGQLAKALLFVHQRGILHRDLKPSNVMLTRDGVIKLMDFGIAKSETGPFADLTIQGMIVGSMRYMPPEQLRGYPLDERADLYAFGVIAYELLTGAAPIGGDDMGEIMYGKMNWKLPRRKKIRKDLDKELYKLLKESLRIDPKKRTLALEKICAWAEKVDPGLLDPV